VLDGRDDPESVLAPLWRADAPEPREARAVLEAVAEGLAELKRWLAGGADIFSENKE
jgi:hypothetical protein